MPVNYPKSIIIDQSKINKNRARILIAGDLYPGGQAEPILMRDHPELIFEGIEDILDQHDLNICDLECPLSRDGTPILKSGPILQADPKCAKGIKKAGFDVVTLANNHIMDMGPIGLMETIESCRKAGLITVGAGENLNSASQPCFLTINDIKIAVLSITEHEFSIAGETRPGAWPLDIIDNTGQIKKIRETADFILLIIHGGKEYYPLPSPVRLKTYHYFADIGVNAIISHHIHLPGGFEIYNNTPIVYGTGNFLYEWPKPKPDNWEKGYMISLEIAAHKVLNFKLIPYIQSGIAPTIKIMDNEEAVRFIEEIDSLCKKIKNPDLIKKEWLKFCHANENQYLSFLLNLTRAERKLLAYGIWPFWRIKKRKLSVLLNLLQCESHHEAVTAILNSILDN
jgi:poly-gamma-glutamate synthesis protein (capsule biosynthesis protein)